MSEALKCKRGPGPAHPDFAGNEQSRSHNDARLVTSPAPFEGLQLLRLSPYTVINLGLVANFREGSYPLSVRTELLSGEVVYYYGEEAETLRAWLGERVPRWGPRLPPEEAQRRLQAAITEMARS